jgi:signal peptidase I
MRAHPHIKRILWGVLGLALVSSLWFLFAPSAIGGSTTYVVTDGISMQPRFHTGDLALVRPESDYRVGQIVAYHNRQLGTVVLHRIIGRTGSRYVFKGDNNNFTDFEHPKRSQLIGALWIHVPGAGGDLSSIRSPALIGVLVALGTLLVGGVSFAKRRRRRRRERMDGAGGLSPVPRTAREPSGRLSNGMTAGIVACALIATLPFFVLAVLSFTRPSAAVLATSVPYRQTGHLSYKGSPPAGPTYPSGSVRTGEPLFTHVVRSVDLAFAYHFSSPAPHRLAARGSLIATVSSTSGWRTRVPLGPSSTLSGDSGVITGRLNIASLLALVSRVESATAVRGSYALEITPHIALGGQLAGAPLSGRFAPASKFALNSLEIRPVNATGSPSEAANAAASFEHSASGSVTARRSRPAHIELGALSMTVGTARAIALAGLALIAAALCAALLLARPRRRGSVASILSRYGGAIVPVERVWQQPGVAVIDVADIDALARVAAHYERSILHERTEYGDAFWVSDESGQFRYAVVDPAWELGGERVGAAEPAEEWEAAAHEAHAAEPAGVWQAAAGEAHVGEPAGDWLNPVESAPPADIEDGGPVTSGWAPAPGAPAEDAEAPPATEAEPEPQIAVGDLRGSLPSETLRFGAVSPSALARG